MRFNGHYIAPLLHRRARNTLSQHNVGILNKLAPPCDLMPKSMTDWQVGQAILATGIVWRVGTRVKHWTTMADGSDNQPTVRRL